MRGRMIAQSKRKKIGRRLERLRELATELDDQLYLATVEIGEALEVEITNHWVEAKLKNIKGANSPAVYIAPEIEESLNGRITRAMHYDSMEPHFVDSLDGYVGKTLLPPFRSQSTIEKLCDEVELILSEHTVDYYNPEYRKLRHEVFLEQGEECAKCGARPPAYLQIDHIKPVSKHPELFLEKNNMQVLCVDCNKEKSNKNDIDYRQGRNFFSDLRRSICKERV